MLWWVKTAQRCDKSGMSEMVQQSFTAGVNCQQCPAAEILCSLHLNTHFHPCVKLKQFLKWSWYFTEDVLVSQTLWKKTFPNPHSLKRELYCKTFKGSRGFFPFGPNSIKTNVTFKRVCVLSRKHLTDSLISVYLNKVLYKYKSCFLSEGWDLQTYCSVLFLY